MSWIANLFQSLLDFFRPPSSGATTTQQPGAEKGNKNWIIHNNGNPLTNASVKYTALSDIIADGNWDMQVNVYSAKGTSAYTQFVMAVTSAGQVQWSIEGWRVSGQIFNTCDHPLYQLPGVLRTGYALSEVFETDPVSGQVTAVAFSVSDGSTVLANRRVTLDQSLPICDPAPFAWDNSYLFVPVALEANVTGYNNGVAVLFSSAQASLAYFAGSGIACSNSIPPFTETKAQTVETSNEVYDQPTGSGNNLTQACHL